MADSFFQSEPGIAGPNQIANRNEEDSFLSVEDPEKYHVERLLSEKLERDIAYVHNHSVFGDFTMLFRASFHTLFKGFSLGELLSSRRTLQLVLFDILCSLFAYFCGQFG